MQTVGGGIGQILASHFKCVTNPVTATVPISEANNSEAREAHRQAHATIFDVMSGAGRINGQNKETDAGKEEAKGGKDKDKDKDAANGEKDADAAEIV